METDYKQLLWKYLNCVGVEESVTYWMRPWCQDRFTAGELKAWQDQSDGRTGVGKMTPKKIIIAATAIFSIMFGAAILRIPKPVDPAVAEARFDAAWADQFQFAVLRKADRLPLVAASITNPEPTPKHPDIVEEPPAGMPPVVMVRRMTVGAADIPPLHLRRKNRPRSERLHPASYAQGDDARRSILAVPQIGFIERFLSRQRKHVALPKPPPLRCANCRRHPRQRPFTVCAECRSAGFAKAAKLRHRVKALIRGTVGPVAHIPATSRIALGGHQCVPAPEGTGPAPSLDELMRQADAASARALKSALSIALPAKKPGR